MVWVPAGTFRMGSSEHYPEEAPARTVSVDGFWIDRFQVTNRQFDAFVADTGYTTVAERPLDAKDFPNAPAENLVPGSLVFTMTNGPVDLRHLSQWWTWTPGASWKHPEGPGRLRRRARRPSRGPRRARRRRGVRGVGREGAAHRG
jgi:formylglycine-generating enzyme required for sulfatase activity